MHRFIYYCFFTVSITGRRVAQKPEIHEDFPGNFTQVVGSEVLLECPIVVNDSFDPPEMLWIEVKLLIQEAIALHDKYIPYTRHHNPLLIRNRS